MQRALSASFAQSSVPQGRLGKGPTRKKGSKEDKNKETQNEGNRVNRPLKNVYLTNIK